MEELTVFAKKVMSEVGVESYDINIEGLIGKGENYVGEILFFNITPKGEGDPMHFVRKKATYEGGEVVRKAYQRETYIYNVFIPEMAKFTQKYNKDFTLEIFPKCYHILEEENNQMLILENVKFAGYQLLDKKIQPSLGRIREALNSLAKFHALSFAMKKLEPENYKKLTGDVSDIWKYFSCLLDANDYFGNILNDVLEKLALDGRADLVSKFKPIVEDMENVVYGDIADEDKLIISHGDAWINNMLFKVDEGEPPQTVCLIDYQISSLGTPVIDITLFLFSAGDKDILNNINDYWKLYHEYLSAFLSSLGVDSGEVYTYEDLLVHLKKYAKTGLVMALAAIQASLAEAEDAPDDLNAFSSKTKNADLFHERVKDLLICYGENFL